MTICQHCTREIVLVEGAWVDPEATGDDEIWRETCDAHDTFMAEHEPLEAEHCPTAEEAWADAQRYRAEHHEKMRRLG